MSQFGKTLYKQLIKPIVYKLDPEFVHDKFTDLGELFGMNGITRSLVGAMYGYNGPDISKVVDGIKYRTPVLLSAGFDYNARLISILDQIAFGGAEFGSITLQPYEGNEKPRLTRAINSQSIIVNKGLKNEGVDKVIERIKSKKAHNGFVTGISIARTNAECTANDEAGIDDYYQSLVKLVDANVGDYYTINISCPNAFGGESFADKERLPRLLSKLKEVKHSKPMYVKMPIMLEWPVFQVLLDIIKDLDMNGVVIGNLNKNYDEVKDRSELPEKFRGGLSGKPCFERSNRLIAQTREYVGDKFTIFGVGGIFSAEDAMQKMKLGADLVQLITGMFMEGPHLMSEIDYKYAEELSTKK